VFEPGRSLALQLRNDALREHFAELDAPLVKGIDVPDHALREHAVFVKRDQLAEDFWREPVGEDDIGRTVALEKPDAAQASPACPPL